MPFPPVFDRAWDETFPPDTQPANLLGQDIRNFKSDIRERVSLISGTFANRPTPDASWGGVDFGMLYFATDTGKIYQWVGAVPAWVDITVTFVPLSQPNFFNQQGPAAAIVGNGADQNIFSFNIVANTIKAGAGIRVKAMSQHSVGGGAVTYKLKFGATVIDTHVQTPFNNVFPDLFTWDIFNNNAVQNAQHWMLDGVINVNTVALQQPTTTAGTSAVDFTVDQLCAFTFNAAGSEQEAPLFWLIENIHA